MSPAGIAPDAEPPVEDCSAGIWRDLEVESVCPTVSDATLTDPDTGETLPPPDDREPSSPLPG